MSRNDQCEHCMRMVFIHGIGNLIAFDSESNEDKTNDCKQLLWRIFSHFVL